MERTVIGIDPGTGDYWTVVRRSYQARGAHDATQRLLLQQRLQRRQQCATALQNAEEEEQQQQQRAEHIELRQVGRQRQARSTFRPAGSGSHEQRAAVDPISVLVS